MIYGIKDLQNMLHLHHGKYISKALTTYHTDLFSTDPPKRVSSHRWSRVHIRVVHQLMYHLH